MAEWNHDFCHEMVHADLIDHLSIHRYFSRGKGAAFTDSEHNALFGDLLAFEKDIEQTDRLLGYFYPDKAVGLIIDEWGVWHPGAVVENGNEQENTLRDAVFAGAALNLFNRYAHRITMTNIAQTINVLQSIAITDGGKMCLTPTYHVFDMMRPHMGATLLTDELECPEFETHPAGMRRKCNVPALSISTSISGKKVFLTVANQSVDRDVEARVTLQDAGLAGATCRVLNAIDPRDGNTYDAPKTVVPKRVKLDAVEGEIVHVFPAHSFTTFRLSID